MDDDMRGEVREIGEVDRSVAAWLGFWVQFGVLGVLAVIGAFFASEGGAPGDYGCGMALLVGALVLAFLRLKHHFDGRPLGWGDFLLVDSMRELAVVIPLFAIIALAGLFLAHAWRQGAPYDAGLCLFVASGAIIFLDIKRVFDRLDQHEP
jgi:hypothetical protein